VKQPSNVLCAGRQDWKPKDEIGRLRVNGQVENVDHKVGARLDQQEERKGSTGIGGNMPIGWKNALGRRLGLHWEKSSTRTAGRRNPWGNDRPGGMWKGKSLNAVRDKRPNRIRRRIKGTDSTSGTGLCSKKKKKKKKKISAEHGVSGWQHPFNGRPSGKP